MVSVYTLGQLSCPRPGISQSSLSTGFSMSSDGHSCTLDQFQYKTDRRTDSKAPAYQSWPWRGFAFCSDLGTVGYLVNKPKLGLLGWVLALPYYLFAIFKQPKGEQRKQAIFYQATANGIFPILEAKAGVEIGGLLHRHVMNHFIQKYPPFALRWLTQPGLKIVGGLMALLALTPTLGDPISDSILERYKAQLKQGQAR